MDAQKLHISGHNDDFMSVIKSLDSFNWEMGESLDFALLLDDPNVSLFCLDNEHQWAVFVMLPDGFDLSRVPFVYQAHLDYAEYLIALPYTLFFKLADEIELDATKIICIHNVGRCGSTLMSQALNEIDGVVALSEPDVIANLVALRHLPRTQQIQLLRASFKMLYRPAAVGDASRFVLKLRNQCVDIMDVFIEAFPEAQHIFMYRNVIDWLSSFYRLRVKHDVPRPQFTRTEALEQLAMYYNRPVASVEQFFEPTIESYVGLVNRSISWLLSIVRYLEIYHANDDLWAIRYEDLISQRDVTLSMVLAELDFPETALQQAQKAFQHDSQAGTKLARDHAQSGNVIRLPDDEIATVTQILSKQAIVNHPDYILPGTLTI